MRPFPDRSEVLLAAAVFFLALLTFLPAVGNDFVSLDDSLYVYDNALVQGGLTPAGVADAFARAHCNFYHPLTMLSLMLDHQLGGLNPVGYHLTNVLLHASSAALLFFALVRMTASPGCSAFVAAVFAVHPLRVESVAWVAERKDVLSGFFFMLTLAAYAWYAARPASRGRYLAVIAAFALGLLAKTSLVTMPALFLLLDYWPLRRFAPDSVTMRRLLGKKIPLFALALLASVAAVFAQKAGVLAYADFPLASRIGNAVLSYGVYLRQTFWPLGLSPFYPFSESALTPARVAGTLLVLLAITAWSVRCIRRQPYLAVGWFWFIGVLVPMIGLVQVGTFAHADRFTYLPQVGLLIMLAWGAADLARRGFVPKPLLTGAAAGILGLCVAGSVRQTRLWADTETLFRHAVTVTRDNGLAHGVLGAVLLEKRHAGRLVGGSPDAAAREEAIRHLREAARLLPDHADARLNLGLALAATPLRDEAIRELRIGLKTMHFHAPGQFALGALLLQKGETAESARVLEQAVRLKPANLVARNNLATAYRRLGRLDDAIREYRAALARDPNFGDAHNNLGIALYQAGHPAAAIGEFQEALRCDPDNASARQNLEAARR